MMSLLDSEAMKDLDPPNQDTDCLLDADLVPTFSNLKLEFTTVITKQGNRCKVCNEPILVERKAHPDVHTACLSSSSSSPVASPTSSTTSSARSAQSPTICTFCNKKIIIKYRDHPSLHTTCKAALARGEAPPVAPTTSTTSTPLSSEPSTRESKSFEDIVDEIRFDKKTPFERAVEKESSSLSSSLSSSNERAPLQPDFSTQRLASLSTEELMLLISNATDYYEVLGVDFGSPLELIKSNYKRLAMRLHPDKCQDGTEAFKKVSHAFAVLSNEDSRRRYDLARRSGNCLENLSPADLERCRAFVRVTASDIRNVSGMLDKLFGELSKALFGSPH